VEILFIVGFIMSIVWLFVPFAIFGTKDRLDTLIEELQKANAELALVRGKLVKGNVQTAANEPAQ
jgi:hypothetical protein